jgi:hypothetical protein
MKKALAGFYPARASNKIGKESRLPGPYLQQFTSIGVISQSVAVGGGLHHHWIQEKKYINFMRKSSFQATGIPPEILT